MRYSYTLLGGVVERARSGALNIPEDHNDGQALRVLVTESDTSSLTGRVTYSCELNDKMVQVTRSGTKMLLGID